MVKIELVKTVAARAGISETRALLAIDALRDAIVAGLKKDGVVKVMRFGRFEVRKRKARVGRDPRNGKPVKIEAARRVKFVASKAMHEAVR